MEDYKRQQALDNLRNALGRLEQSDFIISYRACSMRFDIAIGDVGFGENNFDAQEMEWLTTISNHTLKLKEPK